MKKASYKKLSFYPSDAMSSNAYANSPHSVLEEHITARRKVTVVSKPGCRNAGASTSSKSRTILRIRYRKKGREAWKASFILIYCLKNIDSVMLAKVFFDDSEDPSRGYEKGISDETFDPCTSQRKGKEEKMIPVAIHKF